MNGNLLNTGSGLQWTPSLNPSASSKSEGQGGSPSSLKGHSLRHTLTHGASDSTSNIFREKRNSGERSKERQHPLESSGSEKNTPSYKEGEESLFLNSSERHRVQESKSMYKKSKETLTLRKSGEQHQNSTPLRWKNKAAAATLEQKDNKRSGGQQRKKISALHGAHRSRIISLSQHKMRKKHNQSIALQDESLMLLQRDEGMLSRIHSSANVQQQTMHRPRLVGSAVQGGGSTAGRGGSGSVATDRQPRFTLEGGPLHYQFSLSHLTLRWSGSDTGSEHSLQDHFFPAEVREQMYK